MENTTTETTEVAQNVETALERANELNAKSNATVLDASIHGDTFEIPLRHLEGVVDDARIQFDENGMYAKAVDSSNVSMARIFIPATTFENYDVVRAGIDGVDVKQFGQTLRSFKTRKRDSDLIELSIGHSYEGDKLYFAADSQGSTEDITTFDADSVRYPPTIPDLKFEASVVLENGNELREWVKSLKSGIVTVALSTETINRTENATLTFENRDGDGNEVFDTLVVDEIDFGTWGNPTEQSLPEGKHGEAALDAHSIDEFADNRAHVRSNYSVEFLKKWAKRLRKTRTRDVPYRLEFGEEWPLKLTREDETDIVTEYMLAPRIMSA